MSYLDRVFESEREVIRIRNPIRFDQLIGTNPSGGQDYFVDGNVGIDGDGSTWLNPAKSLAAVITKSNQSIALGANRWWARRNRIFLCGDLITENLTAFPSKCDVIGVGSYDANSMPGILGQHAPVNTSNYGTRFFNVWFKSTAVADAMIKLVSTSSGIQFLGCKLDGTLGTVTTAITATASPFLKVVGCTSKGGFATAVISITGVAEGTVIEENVLNNSGVGAGVLVAAHSGAECWILKNVFKTTGICISAASTVFNIVGNRGITLNDNGTALAGAVIGSVALALDNAFTCSGTDGHIIWPAITVIGS
jgi:hypothetical protein